MNPLTEEYIEQLKALKLKEYASLPVLYDKEINNIFFCIIPDLIVVAEDHALLSARIKVLEEAAYNPDNLKENQLPILRRFMNEEGNYIHALEMDFQALREHYDKKYETLTGILPLADASIPEIKVRWYMRIFAIIKKATKELP